MHAIHSRRRTCIFWLLAIMEFFERYGFYIVMALLIILLTKHLGWPDARAYTYTAAVSALIYIAPLAGGWITDHYLNNKIALIIGSVMLCLSYVALSFWQTLGINPGIAMIIIGMAFFKFAPSAMIGQLYSDNKKTLDSLFVIFYVSINVGALIAFFTASWLAIALGWSYVFLIPAFGLMIASAVGLHLKTHLQQDKTIATKNIVLTLAGAAACWLLVWAVLCAASYVIWITCAIALAFILVLQYQAKQLHHQEKTNLIYLLVMCFIAVIFFILYAEQSTMITLFAERICQEKLFGLTIHPSSYAGFDAFWILILSPFVSIAFRKFDKTNSKHALMYKFSCGLLMTGLGYFILYLAMMHTTQLNSVNPVWPFLSFALQALGEIFVSALGLSLMAKWAPQKLYNACMGGWFVVVALGSNLSGEINAHFISIPQHASVQLTISTYQHGFCLLTLLSGLSGLAFIASTKWICNRLSH